MGVDPEMESNDAARDGSSVVVLRGSDLLAVQTKGATESTRLTLPVTFDQLHCVRYLKLTSFDSLMASLLDIRARNLGGVSI